MARKSPAVLLGRKDLIDAAMYNSAPWEGAVCRPMKVGKEEIMGVLAAIDYWSKADIAAIDKNWQRQLERIAKLVRDGTRSPDGHRDPAPGGGG